MNCTYSSPVQITNEGALVPATHVNRPFAFSRAECVVNSVATPSANATRSAELSFMMESFDILYVILITMLFFLVLPVAFKLFRR